QLRDREERLRLVTNALPVLIAYVDAQEVYRFANATYLSWFGVDPEGKTVREMLGDEAYERLRGNFRRVLAGESLSWTGTVRYARAGTRHVHIVYVPHVVNGQVVGFYALVQDLTSGRETEEQLRDREERLRLVTNALPVLIAYIDAHEVYQFANATYLSWFGESPEGKTLREVLGNEAYDRLRDKFRRVLAGESVSWTGTIPYARAGTRDVQVDYIPHVSEADGRVLGFYSLVQDLTPRRETEEKLRRSEEEFRAIFELAGSGKAQADVPSGRFMRVNRRFCAMTGYSEEELLGMTFVDLTHPDDREADVARVDLVWRGIDTRWESEKRYVRKDGSIIWVLVTGTLIRFGDGEKAYTIATIQDITDRKLAEQALKDADRRKDEFLATLAHELRNPLAPVRTGIELLQQNDVDAAASRQILGVLQRQTAQLVRLVDDLLDVSRFTRGKITLQPASVSIREMLATALEGTRLVVEQAGHRVDLRLPAEDLRIEGDPARLAQVFSNLISNAAKYTPEPGEIVIEARAAGGRLVIAVRDHGVGIPPEKLPKIFDMFEQLENPLDRGQGGLGIGLTLVKSLVELHGGTVEVESQVGRGTEFRVILPWKEAPPAPPAEEAAAPHPAKPRRVLIVDDNEDAATLLQKLLTRDGHSVRVAFDGEQGLELAAADPPEVVLLDLGMPRMNGYEVAKRVRASAWGKDLLLVAITGWAEEETRARTEKAGFNVHLVKPVSRAALRAVLAMDVVARS
ncbi:MAG TPA: PAS domain S-box protein, partial [Thermoanaerobaculia bacterium]